ncbi:MAG: hypothetical protein GY953_38185, partial [bacterium]|nr:hypothetical protein [bacterium]
ELWRRLNGKVSMGDVEDLRRAGARGGEEAVQQALQERLGVSIRNRPTTLNHVPVSVRRRTFGTMPSNVVDLQDVDDSLVQMDRLLSNAAFPIEDRNRFLELIADNGTKPELVAAEANGNLFFAAMTEIEGRLLERGMDPGKANQITRLYEGRQGAESKFWIDVASGVSRREGLEAYNGFGLPTGVQGPHTMAEFAHRLALPNTTDLTVTTKGTLTTATFLSDR